MLIRNKDGEQTNRNTIEDTSISIYQVWAQVHQKYGAPDVLCDEYFATMEEAEMRLGQVKTYRRLGQTNDDGAYEQFTENGMTLEELQDGGSWAHAFGIREIHPLKFVDDGRVN